MPAGWVSAAAAVAGGVENYENNQSQASATSKNNAANAELTGAQGQMLNQGEAVASQPFQAYTGTLTAPMSANQQQGTSLAASTATAGQAQQDNAAATGLVGEVANSNFDTGTINKYMNPYTQDVTDASVAAANKSYQQNLSAEKEQAEGPGGSSAFGGSREAIQEGEMAGQNQLNVGTLTATGNANAFNSAVQNWQNDNTMKLNAANGYETAGQDLTNMTSDQISDLMKTGGVAQAISQTDLSNQYNQFMRQQGWSAQQLGSLISAVGSDKGSPAQTAATQSNAANQLLGVGSTIAGLYGGGAFSSSGSNSGAPSSATIAGLTSGSTTGANSLSNTTVDPGALPEMPSIEGGGP